MQHAIQNNYCKTMQWQTKYCGWDTNILLPQNIYWLIPYLPSLLLNLFPLPPSHSKSSSGTLKKKPAILNCYNNLKSKMYRISLFVCFKISKLKKSRLLHIYFKSMLQRQIGAIQIAVVMLDIYPWASLLAPGWFMAFVAD